MDDSRITGKSIIAFIATFIIGFIIGYSEISASSDSFRRAYNGILSFIVGSEIWVSGISAAIIWLILITVCSIVVAKIAKSIEFRAAKECKQSESGDPQYSDIQERKVLSHGISVAFVVMCATAILSFFNIDDAVNSLLKSFKYIKYIGINRFVGNLTQLLSLILPTICIIMLILNKKYDVKLHTHIILLICGILTLVSLLLNYSSFAKDLGYLITNDEPMLLWVIIKLAELFRGILFIAIALSIKRERTILPVQMFSFVNIMMGVLLLLLFIFAPALNLTLEMSIIDIVISILLPFALWCLPKTLYNYNNCFFVGIDSLKLLGISVAGIFCLIIIAGLMVGGGNGSSASCGHAGCKENGPFPCYGKNNTCNNTTDCCYDLYCDWCD